MADTTAGQDGCQLEETAKACYIFLLIVGVA